MRPGPAGRSRSPRATFRRCSSRFRAAFRTASWTAPTTRCSCAATMPRSAGSCSARCNRSSARASGSSAAAPIKPGDGVVFDGDESTGPRRTGRTRLRGHSVWHRAGRESLDDRSRTWARPARVELRFGRGDIDLLVARSGPASLEDRRSRADSPAAPLVRRAAGSQESSSTSRFEPSPASRLRITGTTPIGGRGHRSDGRAAGDGRNAGRRPRPVPSPARPAGRHDLPASRPGGDDRGRADGPQEPAQPVAPRAGRPAGRRGRVSRRTRRIRRPGPAAADGADRGRALAADRFDGRASSADRAGRPVPANRADRGGPRARHFHDLRRLSGHQAIRRGHRDRTPAARARA